MIRKDTGRNSCSSEAGVGVEKHIDGYHNCGRPSASTFSSFSVLGSFTARTRTKIMAVVQYMDCDCFLEAHD